MNAAREAFLARSEPGRALRVADEFCLEQFDHAGLGEHPKVLAMLEALASPEQNLAECRKAKGAAYKLLEKTKAAATQAAPSSMRP